MDLMVPMPSAIATDRQPPPAVLVVSENDQAHAAVQHVLANTGWEVHCTFGCEQALQWINNNRFVVVLCDQELAHASWVSLLERTMQLGVPPRLILFSRLADSALWAEVLNLGAYDLLEFPFEREELVRITSFALESWRRERQMNTRAITHLAATA